MLWAVVLLRQPRLNRQRNWTKDDGNFCIPLCGCAECSPKWLLFVRLELQSKVPLSRWQTVADRKGLRWTSVGMCRHVVHGCWSHWSNVGYVMYTVGSNESIAFILCSSLDTWTTKEGFLHFPPSADFLISRLPLTRNEFTNLPTNPLARKFMKKKFSFFNFKLEK